MTAKVKMPLVVLFVVLLSVWLCVVCSPAFAGEPEGGVAQWTITAVSAPTNFVPEDSSGEEVYRVLVRNTGSAASSGPVTVTDTLPAGLALAPAGITGKPQLQVENGAVVGCSGLQCTFPESLPVGDGLTLTIPVETGAPGTGTNVVSVSGGGALPVSKATVTQVSSMPAGFGIASGSANTVLSSDQAGAHADLTTTIAFNTTASNGELPDSVQNTTDDLPPGFAGDLVDQPVCTIEEFSASGDGVCPVDTQVGSVSITFDVESYFYELIAPVYNLSPNPGATAKLAFFAEVFAVQGDVSVRPGDEGLETTFHNVDQATNELDSVALTIWGVPNSPIHNDLRGIGCHHVEDGKCPVGTLAPSGKTVPFLTNPTSCSGDTLQAEFKSESWETPPGTPAVSEPMLFGPLTGCEHLAMDPSITVEPTTTNAGSATGLDVNVEVPQTYENPYGLATPNLKKAVVTLPEGMSLNPSAASGLGYCTEQELSEETATSLQGEHCPNDAKIGTVRVKSPGIAEEATGALYVAQPYANRFGSLVALYIVAKIPDRGIIVRSEGEVQANPVTGQLTTTFPENPQLPFTTFTLSFRQGQTSPLITPPACGSYTATGLLTPWSDLSETIPVSGSFTIPNGIGGGPCPSGGVPPFAPQVTAGSENNDAAAYTPLNIRIARQDGEQEITGFASQLPPGLTANLTGVPFCPEADIQHAREVSGAQEEAEPSCPAASEIGHSVANAGVGQVLAQAPGKLYMAGPFEGAPFSVVSITAAHVGPFDLGTVVVHLPLFINPETADVTIPAGAADQIPHIIKGIIIHVREILVYINRPSFTLNPTNCNPMSFAATVIGGGADPGNPADNDPVTSTAPFRVTACQALKFEPKFSASTSGKTSREHGASLSVKLAYPTGALGQDTNIKQVKVELPKQLPSRLTTLQKACTAAQFDANPAGCPAASVVGHAKALTPILPVPLEGPAYFVSHGGEAFPSLEVVLQGDGVKIVLTGNTFISKKGITSSTFKTVPDQPVSSFELTLPDGQYSALAANGNLCKTKLAMPTEFVAQNGAVIHQTTTIATTGCAKVKGLSRAQKLARALKACRKQHGKRRAACARQARRRYGPKRPRK
jgi:uncharacterized repeat protein (TIGR01451 family)